MTSHVLAGPKDGETGSGPGSVTTHIEPTSNQTYSVTPTTATTVDIASGNIAYTATGLDNTKTYDLALFSCANVNTSTATVKFLNSTNPGGSGNVAVAGTTGGATITVLNGVAVGTPAATAFAVAPSAGQITFTVHDTTAGDCVVPVLYGTADANNVLNLGTNNQPTDAFGVGGAANFINPAAAGVFGGYTAGGAIPTAAVTAVSGMTFTSAGLTYTYKLTDSFFMYDGTATVKYVASTEAAFAAALSVGDTVAGIYQPTGTSTFVLNDIAPAAPTGLAKQTSSGANLGKAGVTIIWTDSTTATVASYNVYRATAIQPATTGAPVTCPAASVFAKIGSVANVTAATTYGFFDGTATPPPTASVNPSYCYKVTSVDEAGDESLAASVGPLVADEALVAAGVPTFIATGNTLGGVGTYTILVHYSTAAVGAVDADGSDFSVVYFGADGIGRALTVTAASAATNAVTITATAANGAPAAPVSGSHVIVTAKAGADLNTVSDTLTVPKFQAVGDSVFVALP